MKKIIVFTLALFMPVASFATVQIVVLNVQDAGSNRITYNYLCWLNAVNPLPNPNFVSAPDTIVPSGLMMVKPIMSLSVSSPVMVTVPSKRSPTLFV